MALNIASHVILQEVSGRKDKVGTYKGDADPAQDGEKDLREKESMFWRLAKHMLSS